MESEWPPVNDDICTIAVAMGEGVINVNKEGLDSLTLSANSKVRLMFQLQDPDWSNGEFMAGFLIHSTKRGSLEYSEESIRNLRDDMDKSVDENLPQLVAFKRPLNFQVSSGEQASVFMLTLLGDFKLGERDPDYIALINTALALSSCVVVLATNEEESTKLLQLVGSCATTSRSLDGNLLANHCNLASVLFSSDADSLFGSQGSYNNLGLDLSVSDAFRGINKHKIPTSTEVDPLCKLYREMLFSSLFDKTVENVENPNLTNYNSEQLAPYLEDLAESSSSLFHKESEGVKIDSFGQWRDADQIMGPAETAEIAIDVEEEEENCVTVEKQQNPSEDPNDSFLDYGITEVAELLANMQLKPEPLEPQSEKLFSEIFSEDELESDEKEEEEKIDIVTSSAISMHPLLSFSKIKESEVEYSLAETLDLDKMEKQRIEELKIVLFDKISGLIGEIPLDSSMSVDDIIGQLPAAYGSHISPNDWEDIQPDLRKAIDELIVKVNNYQDEVEGLFPEVTPKILDLMEAEGLSKCSSLRIKDACKARIIGLTEEYKAVAKANVAAVPIVVEAIEEHYLQHFKELEIPNSSDGKAIMSNFLDETTGEIKTRLTRIAAEGLVLEVCDTLRQSVETHFVEMRNLQAVKEQRCKLLEEERDQKRNGIEEILQSDEFCSIDGIKEIVVGVHFGMSSISVCTWSEEHGEPSYLIKAEPNIISFRNGEIILHPPSGVHLGEIFKPAETVEMKIDDSCLSGYELLVVFIQQVRRLCESNALKRVRSIIIAIPSFVKTEDLNAHLAEIFLLNLKCEVISECDAIAAKYFLCKQKDRKKALVVVVRESGYDFATYYVYDKHIVRHSSGCVENPKGFGTGVVTRLAKMWTGDMPEINSAILELNELASGKLCALLSEDSESDSGVKDRIVSFIRSKIGTAKCNVINCSVFASDGSARVAGLKEGMQSIPGFNALEVFHDVKKTGIKGKHSLISKSLSDKENLHRAVKRVSKQDISIKQELIDCIESLEMKAKKNTSLAELISEIRNQVEHLHLSHEAYQKLREKLIKKVNSKKGKNKH